jgi:hypothetical protein
VIELFVAYLLSNGTFEGKVNCDVNSKKCEIYPVLIRKEFKNGKLESIAPDKCGNFKYEIWLGKSHLERVNLDPPKIECVDINGRFKLRIKNEHKN